MFRQSTIGMVAAVVAFASVAYGQAAPIDVIDLTVDVAEAKAEISPLVYGQFIEHLGRCIRDGIWAEKLRDRKFLLEIGQEPVATAQAGRRGGGCLPRPGRRVWRRARAGGLGARLRGRSVRREPGQASGCSRTRSMSATPCSRLPPNRRGVAGAHRLGRRRWRRRQRVRSPGSAADAQEVPVPLQGGRDHG